MNSAQRFPMGRVGNSAQRFPMGRVGNSAQRFPMGRVVGSSYWYFIKIESDSEILQ
ncbi:hypothetical protein [Leptospira noguchii]|uniref:hypothetical protein n=1 Tax=Leptospira noguchii TaxID=28182 RepID=UPI001FB5DDA5|nr:hypothetical protein [Leptospira noguchii]UOG43063.1 hypothetical protein MAL05_08580 [Leptospira noguchii]